MSAVEKEIYSKIETLVKELVMHRQAEKIFVPGESVIPPSGKVVDDAEIMNMVEASLDAWLTTGRFNQQFQRQLAGYLGRKVALTVNSGSSANLVAFSSLLSPKLGERRIKPGDEVITVAAGFPTTVNPILQNGCVPVFVDVEVGTYNVNVEELEAAIGPKTRAVMIAHALGNPFNVERIKALCEKHDLWLVEDCCDALGSAVNGQLVGSFGDIGTLSFYPAHHITMGEGGAVFTDNLRLKRIAESVRDWGRDCYCEPGVDNTCKKRFGWKLGELPEGYDHKYTYSHMGYNLKIGDMQAACGLAQLDKLEGFVEKRKTNFDYLYAQLLNLGLEKDLVFPRWLEQAEPSWFGFPLTVRDDTPGRREDLLRHLSSRAIGTRLLFAGNLLKQPYMIDQNFRVASNLKHSDTVMRQTFWVGIHPQLDEEQLNFTARSLKEFFG